MQKLKNTPHFQIIDNDQKLLTVCQQAQRQSAVALDTEFVRTRSYYPKLGLIQLYDGEQVSLIDPLAIRDFSPFVALLQAPQTEKVLHSCSEDLEVFQHYFQQLPRPMRDTQIIAQFLGLPASMGFASLIEQYFQQALDKSASRTNWLARPLSAQQLQYAADDVWYLLPLYQQMQIQLQKTKWQSAVENECELLLEKKQQVKSNELAYLSISNSWRLNQEELLRLKLLAKWRQEEAIKRNLALNFVIKAEHLWQVAKYNPKHTSQLIELGLTEQEVRIHGKKLLQLLAQSKRIAPEAYPLVIQRLIDDPRYKKALKALQHKLKEMTPQDLPSELIASKRSLEQLMKWHWQQKGESENLPDLLIGWRKVFGEELLQTLITNTEKA